MPKPRTFDDFPVGLKCEFGPYSGVVEEVHDGDTVLVTVDAGFSHFPCVWIRLAGIRAPELWEFGGPEARDHAATLAAPGTPCRLATSKMPRTGDQKMSFVRYEGGVLLTDGTDLGSAQVASGHAVWANY